MSERRLRVGVAGLGRAFMLTLPSFAADSRVRLVAAADPRAEATARFAAEFGGPPRHFFEHAIEACTRAGLLAEQSSGDLRLTARGRLLSDSVFAQLV